MMPTIADRFAEIRTLNPADIARIADTYHAWRGDDSDYANLLGFCKAAPISEVRDHGHGHGHGLTPGRYVGAEAIQDDGVPFTDKMARLTATRDEQFAESAKLEAAIRTKFVALGIEALDADRP